MGDNVNVRASSEAPTVATRIELRDSGDDFSGPESELEVEAKRKISDIGVFPTSLKRWFILLSSVDNRSFALQGKDDITVFRQGAWYFRFSSWGSGATPFAVGWGLPGDDGDVVRSGDDSERRDQLEEEGPELIRAPFLLQNAYKRLRLSGNGSNALVN